MNKEISIIVAGRANTGKSTMMLQLEKLLKDNGYNVEVNVDEHPDYTGENSFHFHNKEEVNFDKKVAAIKASTKITLKEAQIYYDVTTQKGKIKESCNNLNY